MVSDETPDLHIESEWFSVDITDKESAEAAFELVQHIFVQYIGKAPQAGEMDTKPPKREVFTECPECEYSWIFNGHYPKTATCPQCSNNLNALENEIETDE